MTNYFHRWNKYAVNFFLIFYLVGFIGIVIPATHHLFLSLFSAALILSMTAILLFHKNKYNITTILVLSIIALSGYFIEVAGVNTHLVFGNYSYGNALGSKVFGTPLLIGVNWVMLTYAGSSLTENIQLPVSLKIITASLFMLLYDIILEQIAADLDMWYWSGDTVPLRNYLAWLCIAIIFQAFIKTTGVKSRNGIAAAIIMIQIGFFTSLIIFYKLIK